MPTRKPAPVIISNDQQEIRIYTTESHGRPLHQLSYYRGGKRERRSFADLNEAKREARIILGQIARDSIEAENLTAAEIESYTVARRVLAPLNTPVHVAAEAFATARRALAPEVAIQDAVEYFNRFNRGVVRKQVSDLLEEFIESRRATTVTQGYLTTLGRNVCGFGRFTAGKMLPDLRARDLDDFLQQLPWQAVTKNGARQHIITFSNWAKRRHYLPFDWNEFEGALTYNEPPKEVVIYSPEEARKILNAAGKHLATPFIAIGCFAGLRSAEIKRLDWKNVNFERGFIEVRADICKTKARRLVPISDNLRGWLKPFAMPSGAVVIHHNIHEAVKKIAERAGLEWKKNAMRRSYVSYRLAQTSDPARTALEAGHDQTVLFQFYREVVTPALAEEWFSIMPPIEMQRGLVGMNRKNIGFAKFTPWQKPSAVYRIKPQRLTETAA